MLFMLYMSTYFFFFFFNDTATTEIYTLSLHDALPIFGAALDDLNSWCGIIVDGEHTSPVVLRSEEHTSELQSLAYLVCRLLLEKKKKYCSLSQSIYTL